MSRHSRPIPGSADNSCNVLSRDPVQLGRFQPTAIRRGQLNQMFFWHGRTPFRPLIYTIIAPGKISVTQH